MLKELFLLLAVASAGLAVVVVVAYFLLRALFIRLGERISADIERRIVYGAERLRHVTGPRAHAVGRGIRTFGRLRGIDEQEASRLYLERIERLARLMDAQIQLPIIGGVGVDAALGLIPVVGDIISWAISLRIIRASLEFGLPKELIAKMIANELTDLLLGLIPVFGDFADIMYKADIRNVALLKDHLRQRGSPST
jgi:hypothetical protein